MGVFMKKLFLATTAVVLLAGSASAADLRMPVKAAPVYKPVCAQFGGFYVGGQVGSTYYDHRWNDLDNFGPGLINDDVFPRSSNSNKWSWHGGVLGGFNWQTNCTVFGVEIDWNWADARASKFHTLLGDGTDESLDVSSRLKWFGTARARTGVVVDNLLLYVTGGFAWARFDRDYTFFDDDGPTTEIFSSRHTRWGWTAGVGTEWSITSNVSLKSEVLYIGFTQREHSHLSVIFDPGFSYRFDDTDSMWVSRVGLNFRWGGVVAKY
jgi:outer membrane immunogenic protein